jgi:hypothetical protein
MHCQTGGIDVFPICAAMKTGHPIAEMTGGRAHGSVMI